MLFPKMFRGGAAELRLTNPEDMLETGIEILAQPPGKKLGNIELMSGGEKALTAVSLIFAIFQHQALAVLHPRRGRRAARRGQRHPLQRGDPRDDGPLAVHPDHAHQANHAVGRRPLRRDHARARRFEAREREGQ